MTGRFGKFALLLALAVMPLQGTAATLAGVLCDPGAQHQMHANDGHDRGAHEDGDQDKGNTGGNSAWHPFHSTVFGTVVVTVPATAPDLPQRALAPDPSHDLFVPEQPQRPPLA
ncbi:MAG: hypothetical protein HYY78_03055 [Betaproteobacteria bacterium]|nr:hypothetical protein [Betaproteobacteria bacterium]